MIATRGLHGHLTLDMRPGVQKIHGVHAPRIGLIALAYLVTETMVSILRRLHRKGGNPGTADRLHRHSLVYRSRARRLAARIGIPQHRNAATSVIVGPLPLLTTGLTIRSPENPGQTLVEVALVVGGGYL